MDSNLRLYRKIWNTIQSAGKIIILSHARPDGDALGSQMALYALLHASGYNPICMNRDGVPDQFNFLPGADRVVQGDTLPDDVDLVICIECTERHRAEIEIPANIPIINIDHHPRNTAYGDINWIDPTAPCIGAMLLEFQESLGLKADLRFYIGCYTALISDTGNFSYNLTPRTFQTALKLIEHGVPAQQVTRSVFWSYPERRFRLLARVLDTLELHANGKIAFIRVTQNMIQNTGASYFDTEGFVDYPLKIRGVEVSAFFKELGHNVYRISFRSNGLVSILTIAEAHGGGGHNFAAACTIRGPYEKIHVEILNELEALVDEQMSADEPSADLTESIVFNPVP